MSCSDVDQGRKFPVRIQLSIPNGYFYNFTALDVPFVVDPIIDSTIIFNFKEDLVYISKIKSVICYMLNHCVLVNTIPFNCHPDQIKLFISAFKDLYEISDICESESPIANKFVSIFEKLAYISVDSTTYIEVDYKQVKKIGEYCRSILIGQFFKGRPKSGSEFDDCFRNYNTAVEKLHNIIINKKHDNMICLHDVLCEWETYINQNNAISWDADMSDYLDAKDIVFQKSAI